MGDYDFNEVTQVKQNLNKYLLLDSRLIESTENAKISLGKIRKDIYNPLFTEEKPWEVRLDNLDANIIFDEEEKIFKCWYSSFIIDERTSVTPLFLRTSTNNYWSVRPNGRETGVCYAESKDGIKWEKPNLGIIEFNGSKNNNIVVRDYSYVNMNKYNYVPNTNDSFKTLIADNGMFCGPVGTGIFKDLHEYDPMKRYKMFGKFHETICVSFSKDGLNWENPIPCLEIDATADTHSNALWVPELNKYVGITRVWNKKLFIRKVGWTCSEDFIHWTKAKAILEGEDPNRQVYYMPVFRFHNVYLGLPAIFNNRTDTVHTELAWSPNTFDWYRICPGTPFISRSKKDADYDWGCIFAAAHPIFLKNKILIYYLGANGPHTGWRDGFLCLTHLRPDGFAGYEPYYANNNSFLETKPITCTGKFLRITADINKDGFVKITLLHNGKETQFKSKPLTHSGTDVKVYWVNDNSIKSFYNKKISIKFAFAMAKIYSFSFS